MRVLITGADGFIGRALVERLLREVAPLGQALSKLVLIDQHFSSKPSDPRVQQQRGQLSKRLCPLTAEFLHSRQKRKYGS